MLKYKKVEHHIIKFIFEKIIYFINSNKKLISHQNLIGQKI
jgi:hypothetical protein